MIIYPNLLRRNYYTAKLLSALRTWIRMKAKKSKSAAKDFPVVCVGGSAGGLDTYTRLLLNLPADMGVAIVIVNHLRTVATLLHEILPHHTKMPVELIPESLDIQPDHVF